MTDVCPGVMLFWRNGVTGKTFHETVVCVDESKIVVICEDLTFSTYTRKGRVDVPDYATVRMPEGMADNADAIIYPEEYLNV